MNSWPSHVHESGFFVEFEAKRAAQVESYGAQPPVELLRDRAECPLPLDRILLRVVELAIGQRPPQLRRVFG